MTARNRADITVILLEDAHSASMKPVKNQKKHKKRRSVKRLSGNL